MIFRRKAGLSLPALNIALLSLLLLLQASSPPSAFARAQEQNAKEFSFEGDVSVQQGSTLAEVLIELLSPEDAVVAETQTDIKGHFILLASPLQVGHFRLRFAKDGYTTAIRGFDITAKTRPEKSTLNVVLRELPPLKNKGGKLMHVPVFFATDRAPTNAAGRVSFGVTASESGLTYGVCDVTLPPGHVPGVVETPSIWKLEFSPNAAEHIVIEKVEIRPGGDFFQELKNRIGSTPDRNAFVFIHGYNTTFDDAVRRTAQLAYDMRFPGVPIAYTWPSQGSFLGYFADEKAVELTTANLRRFLREVAQRSGASAIYVVAHSMGNRALLTSLDQMVGGDNLDVPSPLRQIIFAAPDVPRSQFQSTVTRLAKRAPHLTLYVSSRDQALLLSREFHKGEIRAGDSTSGLLVLPQVDTVDVSRASTEFLGHSYVSESVRVIGDVVRIFKNEGVPRGLQKVSLGTSVYWVLSP